MSQRARETLAKATPQNQSKAKKADAAKISREERLADRNTSKTAHASQEQNEGSADEGPPLQRRRSKDSKPESEDDEMESSGAVISEAAGRDKLKKKARVEARAPATQVFTEFMVSIEWIAVI